MKSMIPNLQRLLVWRVTPRQMRCLTPEQMTAVKWWETKWYRDWQRDAGILHP
jgi:hypothetical protein